MKLVTFTNNGITHIGVLLEHEKGPMVADLNLLDATLPASLVEFLAEGGASLDKVKVAMVGLPDFAVFPLSRIRLNPPVPAPGKILCAGVNYRDHIEENKIAIPQYPVIFAKYNNCITGPYDLIVIPRSRNQVDWEGELGVVIGKTGKNIPASRALEFVGGYVVFNDVSEREYQFRTSQWTLGKTFDTFGPMGPALVTTDEIPDPAGLGIRTLVNGEVVQQSNTDQLYFGVAHLISYLSEVMTLQPGDLISTGTPGGVGYFREPPRFLKAGDVVRVEIERIGSIENPVVAEA
jgi:acylpyruvate hydrolase